MPSLAVMPVFVASTENLTGDLSNEALGAYLRLLMRLWTHDCAPFPDDDRRLAGAVRVSPQRWRRLRPELEPFFEIGLEGWRHPGLEKLWHQGMEKRGRLAEAGRRGGTAKAKCQINRGQGEGRFSPNLLENQGSASSKATPSSSHESEETLSAERAREEANEMKREGEGGDALALAVVGAWNRIVHPVLARGQPAKLTDRRRALAEARLADSFGGSLARWEAHLRRIAASSFLTGHRRGSRFLVDLTTALDPEWIARIDEGKYDNAEGEALPPTQRAFTLVSVYERDAADAAAPEAGPAAAGPEPWSRVVANIAELRGGTARKWLDPLTCRGLDEDGVVRLEAPSPFMRDRVRDWYASDIRTFWAELVGERVRAVEVEVVVAERPAVAAGAA
jgi:uncharacterized protein YdaU (DUF1376 family)